MTVRLKIERRFLKSFAALSSEIKRRAESALERFSSSRMHPA
jgi:hypothetical protein